MKSYSTVRIVTTNDTNGNPRRGWIVTDTSNHYTIFVREEYGGISDLKVQLENRGLNMAGGHNFIEACYLHVSVSEYNRLLREYPRHF